MKKIMVVDNEPDIVDLTRTVLELGGYQVVTAYSGEESLRMLEKENVDLVLLDIMMPGMSGWDVFNRINKKSNQIKVAFMSVLEISDKRKQVLLDEGLADYIMKPFDKETLLNRVDKILTKTILLVDDKPDILMSVSQTLEIFGYNIIKAKNGQECIEKLCELKNNPDLVLLDIMMPEISGWDIAAKIKDNPDWKKIPIVFLTAKGDTMSIGMGNLTAVDYIVKPFDIKDLKQRLEKILK